MSLLPRSIPVPAAEQMAATLAAVGTMLGPFKGSSSITRTVAHQGADWELTYLGPIGWRLTGPGVEHGIGVDAEEAAAHITTPPAGPAPARRVHVRIGTHRRAYHPDSACPALNGKPETYRGQEVMDESEALECGLALCAQCDAALTAAPSGTRGRPYRRSCAPPGRRPSRTGGAWAYAAPSPSDPPSTAGAPATGRTRKDTPMVPALYGIVARHVATGELLRCASVFDLEDLPVLLEEFADAYRDSPDVLIDLDTTPTS
ncbi:hypothetical protein ACGFR8_07830 [Streptomyces brevispora]|uniref:hypothetical protein n=1 Tax=Streptomyces brevispora TaxID=887462 RepID=UPI003713E296